MIRRIIAVICITLALVALSGCLGRAQTEGQYFVTALGFDRAPTGVAVTAQLIMTGSGGAEDSPSAASVRAEGTTPKQAVYNLGGQLSKTLLLDHCAIVAISTELEAESLKSIFDYCTGEKPLNLAVYMVCARDAGELISVQVQSSPSSGYYIMGIVERLAEENGIQLENRFYQLLARKREKYPVYALPFFTVENGLPVMQGCHIYRDDSSIMALDMAESIAYSVMCGASRGGDAVLQGESAEISGCHTFIKAKGGRSGLSVTIDCALTLHAQTRGFSAALQRAGQSLCDRARAEGAGDIFGIADRIYRKYGKLWREISADYPAIYLSDASKIEYIVRQVEK